MVELRLKGPQIASDLGAVSASAGAAGDSIQVPSFLKPSALTGLPRISDGFDTDTLSVDTVGLTGITAYDWRIVGGATQGTASTLSGSGLGGEWIECEVTCDQGTRVSPAVMVYSSSHMGTAMAASHMTDDKAIVALVPHAGMTHIAVADGNWNDVATWAGGKVPKNGACVLIPRGVTVTYNRSRRFRLDRLRVDGTLTWALDRNTVLLVETMVGTRGSEIIIGTSANRLPAAYTAEIIISGKDYSSNSYLPTGLNLPRDTRLWGRGLISQGLLRIWGREKTTWSRANAGVPQGATSLTLEKTPIGWNVGDEVCIGGTSQVAYTPGTALQRQDEYRTITAIDGATISWSGGLAHPHDNQCVGSTRTDLYPVVMMRRGKNVTIRSEVTSPDHCRGHTACVHHHCTADLWDCEFIDLGRTGKKSPAGIISGGGDFRYHPGFGLAISEEPLTNTSNLQSRYPVHMHHAGFKPVGQRPVISECYVEGVPGHAMVHHGCAADFFNNAMHLFYGCGMVSESANEVGAWVGNLALGATIDQLDLRVTPKTHGGPAEPAGDNFRGGYGFGMRGRAMRVNKNVACSCSWGYVFFHRDNDAATSVARPINPARANIDIGQVGRPMQGQNKTISYRDYPIIHFEDNESIGNLSGFFVTKETPLQNHDVNVHIKRFKSWGYGFDGVSIEYIGGYLLEGLDLIPGKLLSSGNGITMGANTYQIGIRRARIEGNATGIRYFDGLDSQGAHNDMNNTNNPRWYEIGVESVNNTQPRIFDLGPTLQDGLNVTLVDPDLTSDGYDRFANATETFPLTVASIQANGAVNSIVADGTDGNKVDSLGIHPVAPTKTWNDNLWRDTQYGTWGFEDGHYTYPTASDPVLVWQDIISDRASARPFKITKMAAMDAPVWTANGPFTYTATPVVQSDKTATVPENGSVTVSVVAGATGGTGTIRLDTDDYIAPGHGEVTFDVGAGAITYRPDRGYVGPDTMYVFVESDGQYATVRVDVLVGPGGAVTTPVAGTQFSAADGGSQSIDMTLGTPPACGNRRIEVVEYSTDAGVTWRRLCNNWVQADHKVTVESDGTAIAAGSYSLRIRYKTDYDFTTSAASAAVSVTVT